MKYINPMGYWILTLSHNVTVTGKIWLVAMILLRVVILLGGGYSLYKEEEFTCDTQQQGCSTVCYDRYLPVTPFRYWLVQTAMVFLPHALFSVYVFHNVVTLMATANDNCCKSNSSTHHGAGLQMEVLDFSRLYLIQLVLRILLELGFCVVQFFLFGFVVPSTFVCGHRPCPHNIDCFIPRPREKFFLLILMWCIGAVSLILSFVELIEFYRRRRPEEIENQLGISENSSLKHVSCSETPPHSIPAEEEMVIYPTCPSQSLEKTDEFGNDHLITHRQGKTKNESLSNL